VVLQLLGLSVLGRGDQVPHEAFDLVVSAVVDQAVGQEGSADGLHVLLRELLLKTPVIENILPTTPPGKPRYNSSHLTSYTAFIGGHVTVKFIVLGFCVIVIQREGYLD